MNPTARKDAMPKNLAENGRSVDRINNMAMPDAETAIAAWAEMFQMQIELVLL
jgi:hypothetical protein